MKSINRAEPHQHRQECLCHTNPAVLHGMLMRDEPVWHRHSCLCFGKVQGLFLARPSADPRHCRSKALRNCCKSVSGTSATATNVSPLSSHDSALIDAGGVPRVRGASCGRKMKSEMRCAPFPTRRYAAWLACQ